MSFSLDVNCLCIFVVALGLLFTASMLIGIFKLFNRQGTKTTSLDLACIIVSYTVKAFMLYYAILILHSYSVELSSIFTLGVAVMCFWWVKVYYRLSTNRSIFYRYYIQKYFSWTHGTWLTLSSIVLLGVRFRTSRYR